MKNKKGFTLVELLAVIVILALIMGIAVVSIGGVLDSTKDSTYKETAASIIDGVKKQLMINNKLSAGDYRFAKTILEKGGSESPWGGTLNIPDTLSTATGGNCAGGTMIGTQICKLTTTNTACSATAVSFVRIDANGRGAICLTAGSGYKYIDVATGTEAALLAEGNSMITS